IIWTKHGEERQQQWQQKRSGITHFAKIKTTNAFNFYARSHNSKLTSRCQRFTRSAIIIRDGDLYS
ncbi:MAG: hypothetical protein ACKPCM_00910, partial [Pseudanabaena sp.]